MGVDGKVIFEWTVKKNALIILTVFSWLRIWSGSRLL
jgi:hypothetical protein